MHADDSSLIDRTLGSYRVTARLGAGGMGEVYRAHDARLRRDVAIKVLPQTVTSNAPGLARFEREARLLATLNHPNIGAIYGVEESDEVHALVLELVDGDTLAERLEMSKSHALELPDALDIAQQIAEALDAAHEKGIIHRDLKPANVKITPGGVVKVLDFGIGKTVSDDSGHSDASAVSVDTVAGTREGAIVGTPAYMSPEQARGLPVDKRSDVWSFGCVLYEMLAGRCAFKGDDVADTLSRVLQREPDLTALPEATPTSVRRLLVRCLEKDRNKRLPQIAIAAFQIGEALAAPADSQIGVATWNGWARRRRPLVPALAAGALLGAAVIWLTRAEPPAVPLAVTRLQMGVSPADELGGTAAGRPTRTAFALSPDGRTLVFSGVQKNQRALYARPLDQTSAALIPGTEGAVAPFFSPDGEWVAYWVPGQIRKVPIRGGPPVVVAPTGLQIFGASWGDDDRIVLARGTGGLLQVSSGGGSPRELTTLNSERAEVSHRLPQVLPGGDAVLFTVTHDRFPRWDQSEIWLYSRSAGAAKMLIEGGADARYVSSGHLLYVLEGALLAAPFDLTRLEVTGGAVGVVPDVMQAAYVAGQPNDSGAMQVSVSGTGTLAYVTGGVQVPTDFQVMQIDRTGRAEPLPIPARDFRTLRLSPDGTRLALGTVGRDRSIWLYTFARGVFSQLPGAGRSSVPVWMPDGERITYGTGNRGPNNLYRIRADGGGTAELLVPSARNLEPGVWTPDGRELLYYEIPSDGVGGPGSTLWAWSVTNQDARALPGPFGNAAGADVSPDGRWVAYHSTSDSGRLEVYVDAYPGPGPRIQVSTNGGGSPIWRADGRELFYARSSNEGQGRGRGMVAAVDMMAVDVTTRPTLAFGQPRQLFAGSYSMNGPARGYEVTGDGQRFLMLQPRPRPPDVITQLNVVQNWIEELKD